MGIFGDKKKQKIIAVLDIGSGSIAGMIIRQNKEDIPEIISSCRFPVNFLLDVNFEAFWRCTKDALKKVMGKILKDFPNGPDSVLCIFRSPWFKSQNKIINIRRNKPIVIKREFLEKIIKDEEKDFTEKKEFKLSPLKGRPDLIEHEIIRIDLNGYQTKNPLDKTAKIISIYIYMSLGIKEIKSEIEKEILRNFGDVPVMFKTFPSLTFKVLSNIINTKEGLLLVDIAGENTDIFLIRKDFLEEIVSLPRGKNFLLRKIAGGFKTFPQEASSILETYLKGHCSENDSQRLNLIIKDAKDEWLAFLAKAMNSFAEKAPFPQDMFLVGDEIAASVFAGCLKDDNLSQFTIWGKPFEVKNISPESLSHYFSFDKSLSKSEQDVFLMLESLYANKVL